MRGRGRILSGHAADSGVLKESKEEKENCGYDGRLCRSANDQAKILGAYSTGVTAPGNYRGKQPLKCDCGGVDGEAVHRCDFRHRKEATDTDGAAPRNKYAEHGEDEPEIPGNRHRAKG